MFTRREFLGRGAAGVSALSLSGCMPGLWAQTAEAAGKNKQTDRVLLVVELTGGNDGLNTLVPFENDLYYKHRPTLAVAKSDVIRLNDHQGLHPAMKAAGELFRRGQLAIVQGVGYPEPDRSHFRSMEIWHTADTAPRSKTTGWLGRYLDRQSPAANAAPLAGVALTAALPQALQAEQFNAPVISSLDEVSGEAGLPLELIRELSKPHGDANNPATFIGQQAESSFQIGQRLLKAQAAYQSTVQYPQTDLGAQLRRAAQVIAGELGTRVLFAAHDGFDTHSTQAGQHATLLSQLAEALAAFQSDLEKMKRADKVLTLVFSEFGRRVDENASGGTDHGAASCLFVLGTQVQGGLLGAYPSLQELGDGDLIFNTDFRSVYATLLDRWLLAPSTELLGGKFEHLPLLPTKLA